jgi:hypothetical protein
MEDYHWVMFTHAMDFLKESASLKKPIPKHVFTSLDALPSHGVKPT